MRNLFIALIILLSMTAVFGQGDERAKGIELYQDGKFEESVTVLRKVVEADPVNKVAWMYLGASLANSGKGTEALEAFMKPGGGLKIDYKYEKELKVIKKSPAPYTDSARRKGIEGTIDAIVEFKGDGKVGFVIITKGLPEGLNENVVDAARKVKFEAAIRNGRPVSVVKMMQYTFDTY